MKIILLDNNVYQCLRCRCKKTVVLEIPSNYERPILSGTRCRRPMWKLKILEFATL